MWLRVLCFTCLLLCGSCGADYTGLVTVNGLKVPLTESGFITSEKVGVSGVYNFYDGEPAKISCNGNDHFTAYTSTMTLAKEIWNSTDINYFGGKWMKERDSRNYSTEMYIKLTSEYDKATLYCYLPKMYIQIHFKLAAKQVAVSFHVNGLNLFPTVNYYNQIRYQYEYFDGEELRIQSFKDDNLYGDLDCKFQKNPEGISDHKPWTARSIKLTMTLKETTDITTLDCTVQKLNTTRSVHPNISLQFIPNTFDYDPFIKGLSMANVLAKLSDNFMIYHTAIYYEWDYRNGLNLTCCSEDTPGLSWDYKEQDMEMLSMEPVEDHRCKISLSAVFKVKPNVTRSVIWCKLPRGRHGKEKITKIELIQKVERNHVITEAVPSAVRKGTLGFIVNGITLNATTQRDVDYDILMYKSCYKYNDGESLQITSYKDEQMYGDFHCYFKGENLPEGCQSTHLNPSFLLYLNFSTTLELKHKNITLECIVDLKNRDEANLNTLVSMLLELVPNEDDDELPPKTSWVVMGVSCSIILGVGALFVAYAAHKMSYKGATVRNRMSFTRNAEEEHVCETIPAENVSEVTRIS